MHIYEKILATVRKIPYGKVASYSQVAQAVGMPRGARMVGWALASSYMKPNVPWQRVINMKRQISISNPRVTKELQKQLLEEEGVQVQEENGVYTVAGSEWWSFEE